jgi:hypothetical protein
MTCSHPGRMDEAGSAVKSNITQALEVIEALNEAQYKTRRQRYSIHYDLLRKIRLLVRAKRSCTKNLANGEDESPMAELQDHTTAKRFRSCRGVNGKKTSVDKACPLARSTSS